MRFLARDYLEEKYIRQNLLKVFDVFQTEDDLELRMENLISVLKIYRKINDDSFITTVSMKIVDYIVSNLNSEISLNELDLICQVWILYASGYDYLKAFKCFENLIKLFIKVKKINLERSLFK